MIDVAQIVDLHKSTVALWHDEPIENPYEGFLHHVCQQHRYNFELWHQEDIARSPDVGDHRIAEVKRAIDRFNQQRNDAIEKLDDELIRELDCQGVTPRLGAPLNTETPGSTIDRLSIIALRIYHMEEQLARPDATDQHRATVRHKMAILHEQHRDLADSLGELLRDIFAGRKRLKVYRQFKMYNDPALNPYLYQARERRAG